jgi:hypothetical protein
VADKKALILAESNEKDGINKNAIVERDTLSLLLRANMAKDLPNSQRLSDQEVQAQVSLLVLCHFPIQSNRGLLAITSVPSDPDLHARRL